MVLYGTVCPRRSYFLDRQYYSELGAHVICVVLRHLFRSSVALNLTFIFKSVLFSFLYVRNKFWVTILNKHQGLNRAYTQYSIRGIANLRGEKTFNEKYFTIRNKKMYFKHCFIIVLTFTAWVRSSFICISKYFQLIQ